MSEPGKPKDTQEQVDEEFAADAAIAGGVAGSAVLPDAVKKPEKPDPKDQ